MGSPRRDRLAEQPAPKWIVHAWVQQHPVVLSLRRSDVGKSANSSTTTRSRSNATTRASASVCAARGRAYGILLEPAVILNAELRQLASRVGSGTRAYRGRRSQRCADRPACTSRVASGIERRARTTGCAAGGRRRRLVYWLAVHRHRRRDHRRRVCPGANVTTTGSTRSSRHGQRGRSPITACAGRSVVVPGTRPKKYPAGDSRWARIDRGYSHASTDRNHL